MATAVVRSSRSRRGEHSDNCFSRSQSYQLDSIQQRDGSGRHSSAFVLAFLRSAFGWQHRLEARPWRSQRLDDSLAGRARRLECARYQYRPSRLRSTLEASDCGFGMQPLVRDTLAYLHC
jgi:hypothetical protein